MKQGEFIRSYLDAVERIRVMSERPEELKRERDAQMQKMRHFRDKVAEEREAIAKYPRLMDSAVHCIEKRETGYLEEFMLERVVQDTQRYMEQEKTIGTELEGLKEFVDAAWAAEIAEKAGSWHDEIALGNSAFVGQFLDSLLNEVRLKKEKLGAEERLGRALAKSEAERRRLIETEEARKKGALSKEMDAEARKKRARETFAKQLSTRRTKK